MTQSNSKKEAPMRALLALVLCLIGQGFCIQQTFSYCGFLVIHFGLADRDTAGYYAGNLVAAFMVGRMIVGYPVGVLADRWGRKPVIQLSVVISIITTLLFGVSTSYTEAVIVRFFMGFNGITALSKVMVSELCTPETEPFGMACVVGAWYAALIIAPGIGGILYDRAFFGLEERFPQLLPNLLSVVILILSMICVHFWLPETLVKRTAHVRLEDEERGKAETELGNVSQKSENTNNKTTNIKNNDSNDNDNSSNNNNHAENNNSQTATTSENVEVVQGNLYVGLFLSALLGFVMISFDETLTLWAISSVVSGGLGWNTNRLGVCLSAVAVPSALFLVVVYPLLAKRFGPHNTFTIGSFICVPLLTVTPFWTHLGLDTHSTLFFFTFTMVVLAVKASSSILFPSVSIAINHSVPKRSRGRANGIGLFTDSLARAIAPAVTAPVFAWSVDRAHVPWVVFVGCGVLMLIAGVVHVFSPQTKSFV